MSGSDDGLLTAHDLLVRLSAAIERPVEDLVPSARLVEDLEVDSLGRIEIAAVADECGRPLTEDELVEMLDVQDVVDLVLGARSVQPPIGR